MFQLKLPRNPSIQDVREGGRKGGADGRPGACVRQYGCTLCERDGHRSGSSSCCSCCSCSVWHNSVTLSGVSCQASLTHVASTSSRLSQLHFKPSDNLRVKLVATLSSTCDRFKQHQTFTTCSLISSQQDASKQDN